MDHSSRMRRFNLRLVAGLAIVASFTFAAEARAQIGQLIAPGPLSRAHAKLEGAAGCQKCHAIGRKVTGDLCLACHKPIAERMQQQKGVHRAVNLDCMGCHVEHKGADADIRQFNTQKFDHGRDTGFALEGRHAALVSDCTKCHKTRSYLNLTTECAKCHNDPHKPSFGQTCQTCHPMTQVFKDARKTFDHAKAPFVLVGAHQRVACEKCHVNKVYKGLKSALCTDCHKVPHRQIQNADCRSCHTPETWKTQKIDHSRTAFTLKGKHLELACVKCHVKSPVQAALRFDRCAACHQDPHKGTFKQDCSACHTEERFGRTNFDHGKGTKFPLVGKHQALDCVKCHKGIATGGTGPTRVVDFRGLTTTCVSCHTDIHKNQLGQACETCHTPVTFRLPDFKHPRLPEFFGGQHQGVACASCHVVQPPGTPRATGVKVEQWTFKPLATICANCHADVHLGQVGKACETCHAIDAAKFAPVKFAHTKASYQLIGRHASVECRKCHKSETAKFPAGAGTAVRLKGLGTTCVSCHTDQHLGQLGQKCETCHTPTGFKLPGYKHSKQASSLIVGRHSTLTCDKCHKPQQGQYPSGAGTTTRYKVGLGCANCHTDQHRGALGTTCETCHTPTEWRTVSRAFHKTTPFRLEGRHLDVECASCHVNGVIKGTPTRCYDCHWVRRQDDRYQTRLGNECENCHRPTSWLAVTWNHTVNTGVSLSAVHQTLGCAGCHKTGSFQAGEVACFSCHATQYQQTASPNHVAAGFPTTCEVCHFASHTAWSQARFTHTFPLVGVHATQTCASCHKNGVYAGTPNTCVGCHKTDYDHSTNPAHAAAGFPTTCDSCHTPTKASWTATFSHSATYPLVGVHATQTCTACHTNNVYKGTTRLCYGCHKTNYDRSTNPNHAAAGFPTTCDSCHSNSAATWTASFNHSTVYPLVGLHSSQACSACHINNVYAGTPNTCYGCHKTNYDRTTTPNHASSGFPTTCDACHSASATSWTAAFNHTSIFPLVGVHATQPCTACHINNVYHGTPRVCYGCHKTNYDRTTNPNHMAAGFPTTCESCHNPSSATWTASFNHSAIYPLVGVHATQVCSACHINNVYPGTPTTCYGCHKTNYDRTTTPNHAAAGFPTTCDTCHSNSAATWTASFNHTALYPLVGVHATQPCAACHISNVYPGTPTTCYGCHKALYDRTTSPNHAAAGFATTCDTCHSNSASTWVGNFNHSQFFVLAGRHLSAACTDCHKNNVYHGTPRTCYPCHQANYTATTNPNHIGAGFPTTCDTCHKFTDASWTLAVFNHTWFPITSGRHAGNACSACHTDPTNYAVFSCLGCHAKAQTDASHAGRAGYRYDSAACYSCHPRG